MYKSFIACLRGKQFMEHDIKISNNGSKGTDILIDGVSVSKSCIGYSVSQKGGELPKVTLDMFPRMFLEIKGQLEISHLGDLARVMDREMFNEFCVMWKTLHGEL